MTLADWLQWAKEGGVYVSPFLFGALFWLNTDRNRLIADNKAKDAKIESLAERIITIATRLDQFLFNERKA